MKKLEQPNFAMRWETSGLLDKLIEEDKEPMSSILESCALYAFANSAVISQQTATLLFPLARRIFKTYRGEKLTPKELNISIEAAYKKFNWPEIENEGHYTLDAQMEMIKYAEEDFLTRVTNEHI